MATLRFKTLRENVVDAIRLKIINQELKPGERIKEMHLAEEFNTSRGPIREALRQLENEGMIEYIRNAGCTVKKMEVDDYYEIYMLKVNYEILALKQLKGDIPETALASMRQILEQMKALDIEHYSDVFLTDTAFHAEIVKMANLPRLLKTWTELSYANILSGYIEKVDKSTIAKRQYQSHKEIYDALRKNDKESAYQIIHDHYFRTIQRLERDRGTSPEEIEAKSWDFLL